MLLQQQIGAQALPYGSGADGSANGRVNANDVIVWTDQFGQSAEPESPAFARAGSAAIDAALESSENHQPTASQLDWWLTTLDLTASQSQLRITKASGRR